MTMEMKHEEAVRPDGSPLSVATWTPTSYTEMMQQAEMPTSPGMPAAEGRGLWTPEEHQHFIEGIKMFPSGPWKDIASHVGSRTARQTMTHAQKYRQKIARRLRNARMNAQQRLPYSLDASSSRYNALLSNDEQFNDSILSTALAISAERELDMMEELLGAKTMDSHGELYQPLHPSDAGYGANGLLMDSRHGDASDLAFEECIDFLIAKLHEDQLP
ncbi:hypothetical protein Poli38472_014523 [Pythium oligandrum]|uniref:Uncharacterized protein n=2 Tax=Pythiaceae TaxID=4782 RepID=A0A8K1CF57_PYTOL|nr:hypothetical protein Poli38472_014523 [Pythium oligandrum]DBA02637.1 TPA: hypothetical protein N0F65_012009 [Lagenidium giganteum]|eukprot:TMW61062.1 hypothetical protein Poli38472_014523 [Pythium oligandrum]